METSQNLEDNILLEAIRKGRRQEFDCLFRKYYPMLCAYAHRFIEIEDAENIVQDAMLYLWENCQDLKIEFSLSRYLFKMVYNRTLNWIAKQESVIRVESVFSSRYQEIPENLEYYQIDELVKRIQQSVAALPESYREAFVMHHFKGMSYKEMAAVLEISPKTVDYRIQKALRFLREDLKEYFPLAILWLILNFNE